MTRRRLSSNPLEIFRDVFRPAEALSRQGAGFNIGFMTASPSLPAPADSDSRWLYDAKRDPADPRLAAGLSAILRPLTLYFRTELVGLARIPKDRGCLMVSNHALMGIDTLVLYAEYFRKTGRMLRGVAEHIFFRHRLVGDLFMRFGAFDGTRKNAVRLLKAGHSVLCYPGGARESFAERQWRYTLKWEGRMGYLRSALAANVPIVPFASIGPEEAYVTLFREPFLGRLLFGSAKYDFPVFTGLGLLPFPVKFRYVFDEPIDLKKRFGLTARSSDEKFAAVHEKIWRQTQKFIDTNRK